MTQTINIGEMIQKVLEDKKLSAAWLAKRLNNCRTNGHKIIHAKKFNDVLFLMQVSVVTNHNFLQDLAEIIEKEMSRISVQNE